MSVNNGKVYVTEGYVYDRDGDKGWSTVQINENLPITTYLDKIIVEYDNKYWYLRARDGLAAKAEIDIPDSARESDGAYKLDGIYEVTQLGAHVGAHEGFVVGLWSNVEPDEYRKLPSVNDLRNMYCDIEKEFGEADIAIPHVNDVEIKWTSRLTAAAGNCRIHSRLIKLSVPYMKRFPEDLRSVLTHEMIHLLESGHGLGFQRIVNSLREVGAEVFRYSMARATPRQYINVHSYLNHA